MIRSLDHQIRAQHAACDVAIIGAGTAGCLLATRLAKTGLRVVVLESGGRNQAADTHELNRVVQKRSVYSGAEHGRFRALGGTSTRWGGAMLPFLPADLGAHTADWGPAWPIALGDLENYVAELERIFALPGGPYDVEGLVSSSTRSSSPFLSRSPKWPAFRLRNVATVFASDLASGSGPEVWLNAHVTAVHLDASGRASGLSARSLDGGELTVSVGREVVVAAGAIESTRLLLLLDAAHQKRLFAPHGQIGTHFHDHLSAAIARIDVKDRKALNRLAGFRFEGQAMRNNRLELAPQTREQHKLPGAFAHISFYTDELSGFDGLRDVLRQLQLRKAPKLRSLGLILSNSLWFARAALTRFVQKRVLPPDQAQFELHLVTEQRPMASNRIGLSSLETDPFDLPLAEIDWGVSPEDISTATKVLDELIAYWQNSSLAQLGTLRPYDDSTWHQSFSQGGGIYHPGGTLRMAESADAGVVDGQLRTFAVPNLRVLSTATFPSGWGANPTMMLLLLALRAADHISASPS
jgi:choline dehydrogenase-like flavoprotein